MGWLQQVSSFTPAIAAVITALGGAGGVFIKQLLDAKNAQLASKDEQLREKDSQLASKDGQLKEKEAQLASKDEQLKEKDTQLASKDGQLKEKEGQLTSRDEQLKVKDAYLAVMERFTHTKVLEELRAAVAIEELSLSGQGEAEVSAVLAIRRSVTTTDDVSPETADPVPNQRPHLEGQDREQTTTQ